MAELSPQAQAVLSAWAEPVDVDRSLVINGQALEFQARGALAAALRAAADQVVPDHEVTPGGSKIWPTEPVLSIRSQLLAIAAELEGVND